METENRQVKKKSSAVNVIVIYLFGEKNQLHAISF